MLYFTLFSPAAHKNDYEHKLINDLFDGYKKDALPVMNKSIAIDVHFDLAYAQLISLVTKWHVSLLFLPKIE